MSKFAPNWIFTIYLSLSLLLGGFTEEPGATHPILDMRFYDYFVGVMTAYAGLLAISFCIIISLLPALFILRLLYEFHLIFQKRG